MLYNCIYRDEQLRKDHGRTKLHFFQRFALPASPLLVAHLPASIFAASFEELWVLSFLLAGAFKQGWPLMLAYQAELDFSL